MVLVSYILCPKQKWSQSGGLSFVILLGAESSTDHVNKGACLSC